jgi:hypothetical protein
MASTEPRTRSALDQLLERWQPEQRVEPDESACSVRIEASSGGWNYRPGEADPLPSLGTAKEAAAAGADQGTAAR